MKKKTRIIAILVLVSILLTPICGFATEDTSGLAEALSQMNESKNIETLDGLGTDNIDLARAKSKLDWVSKLVGTFISAGLIIILLAILVFVVPDLFFIFIPPLRKHLYPAYESLASSGPSSMGMGMGYSSMMTPSYLGTGFGRTISSGATTMRQWISDACRDAYAECTRTGQPSAGYSMMGMGYAPEPPKRKMLLIEYAKKKILESTIGVIIAISFGLGLPIKFGIVLAKLVLGFGDNVIDNIPDALSNF